MDYFVYKTKSEKEAIIEEMIKMRKFIYGDEDISSLDSCVKLIPYEKVNKSLTKYIDTNVGALSRKGNDCFYRCYGERSEYALNGFKEDLMTNMMFSSSGSKDDIFLEVFYPFVYARYIRDYLHTEDKSGINEELGHLGLLAFANEYNPEFNNDLVICALYNRNNIRSIYENIMGIGSFDRLMKRCESFFNHQNKDNCVDDEALGEDFNAIIQSLKDFFLERMGRRRDIPTEEKEPMIDNFEEVLYLLKEKYDAEKNNITKGLTGL